MSRKQSGIGGTSGSTPLPFTNYLKLGVRRMSKIFTGYPDIPENTSATEYPISPKNKKNSKWKKKMKKQLKKQEKFLERLAELREHQKQYSGDFSSSDNESFANKLGDAFVKALPSVLTAITTGVIGSYFSSKKH